MGLLSVAGSGEPARAQGNESKGMFSWRNFLDSATVVLFVLFDNLCLIMD
jgi:preprotein translocase subunit SecG